MSTTTYYNPNSKLCLEVRQWILDNPQDDSDAEICNDGQWMDRTGLKHSEETKRQISETLKSMGHRPPSNIGRIHSEETKKKLSEMRKGEKNAFYGKSHTSEARKKISDAAKKRPPRELTEEEKKNISMRMLGNKYSVGRKISDKHRQAIIESNRTRWQKLK